MCCSEKICVHVFSLDAKGDEGHSHHQQVQQVEVIPTECSFMEEGSICRHLRRGRRKLEEHLIKKKKQNTFYPTRTRLAQTVTLPLHTSEDRDRKHKHIEKEKHMLTHITLHQAHAHTSPHSFWSLWFGVASSEQWKQEAKSTLATPTALNYMNVVVSHSFHNRLWDEAIKHAFCCRDVRDI